MADYIKIPKHLMQKFNRASTDENDQDYPFVMIGDTISGIWYPGVSQSVCVDGWCTVEQLERIIRAIKQLDLDMKEYVRELAQQHPVFD